jgi:hypothetical protein
VTAGAQAPPELSALEMARNCARAVLRYADSLDRDPLGAHMTGAGDRGHRAAQLAGNLALVSIAEDLHRIVGIMTGQEWDYQGESGAVSEARATREHMRDWAAGDDTHRGEQP